MSIDWAALQTDLIAMIVEEITFGIAVEADTDLLLSDLVDSLGIIRIVGWIEDQLGTEIDPADVLLENFQSVALMVSFLQSR